MRKIIIGLLFLFLIGECFFDVLISWEIYANTVTISKESNTIPEYDLCGYPIKQKSTLIMIKGRIAFEVYKLKGETSKKNIFDHENHIEEITILYLTPECLNVYSVILTESRYIKDKSPLISILLTHLAVKKVEDEQLMRIK